MEGVYRLVRTTNNTTKPITASNKPKPSPNIIITTSNYFTFRSFAYIEQLPTNDNCLDRY